MRDGLRIARIGRAPASASPRADADEVAAVERKIGGAREPPPRFPAHHLDPIETAWQAAIDSPRRCRGPTAARVQNNAVALDLVFAHQTEPATVAPGRLRHSRRYIHSGGSGAEISPPTVRSNNCRCRRR